MFFFYLIEIHRKKSYGAKLYMETQTKSVLPKNFATSPQETTHEIVCFINEKHLNLTLKKKKRTD